MAAQYSYIYLFTNTNIYCTGKGMSKEDQENFSSLPHRANLKGSTHQRFKFAH
jgi:hypothetical protein